MPTKVFKLQIFKLPPLPLQLGAAILISIFSNEFMSLQTKQSFYTISFVLKEILSLILPLIIFSSVFKAFSKISSGGKIVGGLILAVITSNFISLLMSGAFNYAYSTAVQQQGLAQVAASQGSSASLGLSSLWNFCLPRIVPNEVALTFAIVLGLIKLPLLNKISSSIALVTSKIADIFLLKIFIPVLPLFIFGFLVKMMHDNVLGNLANFNPMLYIMMFAFLAAYLVLLLIISGFISKNSIKSVAKELLAPMITAFSTMSSAAALPVSLKAAATNTGDEKISNLVMPITVNIHMVGDAICIPIMAMIVLIGFNMQLPSFEQYAIFIAAFLMAKFSGAGVPGGSILVMIPVLERTLGFSHEMVALITTLYMICDPIITSGNVVGNNLFVMYFAKISQALSRKKQVLQEQLAGN